MTEDTDQMDSRNHPHRRYTDGTLNGLAESSLLKVIQYAITAIALPAIAWSINNAANRLVDVEKALQRNETLSATYELRLRSLEQLSSERASTVRLLSEKAIVLEQEMRQLQRAEKYPTRQ